MHGWSVYSVGDNLGIGIAGEHHAEILRILILPLTPKVVKVWVWPLCVELLNGIKGTIEVDSTVGHELGNSGRISLRRSLLRRKKGKKNESKKVKTCFSYRVN
ncbi:MAG: hypothetical protein R3B95_08870 [Nitrospirales bacterium]|nr:hypothetical protein [Nitrospirales bacterium]